METGDKAGTNIKFYTIETLNELEHKLKQSIQHSLYYEEMVVLEPILELVQKAVNKALAIRL